MKRDKRGRYTKAINEGYNVSFKVPSIKTCIYWLLFIIIIFPWIVIATKFEILKKLFGIFEQIMESHGNKTNESEETPKKYGLFY